ncbi:MAG: PP2C family protein-serine/threonine phosphatase [Vicinamibacterales bacterium]
MADASLIPPPRPPALPAGATSSDLITRPWIIGGLPPRRTTAQAARGWLLGTLPGKTLLVGLVIKLVLGLVGLAVDPLPGWLSTVNAAGTLALVLGLGYVAARGAVWMRRRLLWRVRRKLILSYIFVGLVPSLLIVAFFLLAGLLLFRNMASYLVQTRFDSHAEQARFLAQTVLLDVQRAATAEAVRDTLERQQTSAAARYPYLSFALVPATGLKCPQALAPLASGRMPPIGLPTTAGPWAHLPPPLTLPAWLTCDGVARIIAYDAAAPGADPDVRLVARAVAVPPVAAPTWAVVLDLPISAAVEERIARETGIRLGSIDRVPIDEAPALALGRPAEARPAPPPPGSTTDQILRRWVLLVEHLDWASGGSGTVSVELSLGLLEMYRRISSESALGGAMSNVVLLLLFAVGCLFLVIQGVALIIGLALARQITGAVHDLFTGTQHLRNRDFTHVIPVRARDQLGELADSFNAMTGEVTRLLSDVAHKERLEQEFATAREIQMKLLPQGPLTVPGIGVSAYCEPAREVGGDYYDVFPVGDHQYGFLIADVSGKGVGAGLYMAQLKGLVLSLARQHLSPRELLIAVNRVIADHLDGRSFITMSYLVVDLQRQVMTYARAGHCPLLLVPARRGQVLPPVRTLAPDGLVVGLKLDDGSLFDSLLEEVTVPFVAGDLVVLFTDGISEMMNHEHDCFGEGRLGELAGVYRDLPLERLAATLVHEVRSFGAGAGQHDDMTMLLLRAEGIDRPAAAAVTAGGEEAS